MYLPSKSNLFLVHNLTKGLLKQRDNYSGKKGGKPTPESVVNPTPWARFMDATLSAWRVGLLHGHGDHLGQMLSVALFVHRKAP